MSEQPSLQSGVNVFVDWAKARLDEMAANAATLQSNLNTLDAGTRAQAEQAVAQLNQWIEKGQADIKDVQAHGEASLAQAKTDMETMWSRFQADSEGWAALAKDQHATFQAQAEAQAEAQAKAWQDAVGGYMQRLTEVHAQNKAQAQAQVAQFQAEAQKAQGQLNAKVEELGKAGQASWSAMSTALEESRNAFAKAIETTAKNFDDASKG